MSDENDFENDFDIVDDDVPEEDYTDEKIDESKEEQDHLKIATYKNVVNNIAKMPKRTSPFLTKYEKARIKGVRLQQLASGAKPRVPVTGLKSIDEIVEMELKMRKLPFIIRRTLPNGKFEDWKMEEFESVQ